MRSDPRHELSTRGITQLCGVCDEITVKDWNTRLDPLLDAGAGEPRSYIGAGELARLGIVAELFSSPVRAAIDALYPNDQPVAYHCHVYEIAANQQRPHIRAGALDGWHRDAETLERYRRDVPDYVSLFTWLRPVGADDGAFELVAQPPVRAPMSGTPCVRAEGSAGFTFLWNRSYFHRASPNRGQVRRRVLKVSVQPASLPNDRIDGAELSEARDACKDDPWLHALFGGPALARRARSAPEPIELAPMLPNGTIALTAVQVGAYRLAEVARTARRRVRR